MFFCPLYLIVSKQMRRKENRDIAKGHMLYKLIFFLSVKKGLFSDLVQIHGSIRGQSLNEHS